MSASFLFERGHLRSWVLALSLVGLASTGWPAPPGAELDDAERGIVDLLGGQLEMELPIQVVDPEGNPIAKAEVTPWALRSAQGHGLWRTRDDSSGLSPSSVRTDIDGRAKVRYPYFRDAKEDTKTASVTVRINHPAYAYEESVQLDASSDASQTKTGALQRGFPLTIRPSLRGRSVDPDRVRVLWSDGRCWLPGVFAARQRDGSLIIPSLRAGNNSVLVFLVEDTRPTHFSRIIDVVVATDKVNEIEVPLRTAIQIDGRLSDNVSRPVEYGLVKAETLSRFDDRPDRVHWFDWAEVRDDGEFTIESWPADEPIQLIALTSHHVATSGAPPVEVKDPRDPESDPFLRPHVFRSAEHRLGRRPLLVPMEPLVVCDIRVFDQESRGLEGVEIFSWPNVGWWNNGNQIYGRHRLRAHEVLRARDVASLLETSFPRPFSGISDAKGRVQIRLPDGSQQLGVKSDAYELPVFLGRRQSAVELQAGRAVQHTLILQHSGKEKLGEWDKLAGVVFGCSTRDGQRICALPEVREKMESFAKRFREGMGKRDPALLVDAYETVSNAFTKAGDFDEAAKWQAKAAEQRQRLNP
ncbi:MAG: Ig-like domain-containing protein [Planctomycetota bacterium]